MSVARVADKFQRFIVRHFGGGYNPSVNLFALSDFEVAKAKNVVFGNRGSVMPRAGFRRYDSPAGAHLAGGRRLESRTLFRYSKSDGTREWLLQAGQYIYADDNLSVFNEIQDMTVGTDGKIRISQWKDTVLFASENDEALYVYNRGEATEVISLLMGGIAEDTEMFGFDGSSGSGALDTSSDYTYRFSLDVSHGDNFIGETNTTVLDNIDSETWNYNQVNATTSTGEVRIQKNLAIWSLVDKAPGVTHINVFRSLASSGFPQPDTQVSTLGFIGQIPIATFEAAGTNGFLFKDKGLVAPSFSRIPQYNRLTIPPPCRCHRQHKNRNWYIRVGSNPNASIINNVSITANMYRIYFSEYLEPASVRATSFFDIGPEDGEAITQAFSWKNKALFVFKPNSTWGVFGGDNESINSQGRTTGFIDIEIERIDETIGCVAPDSLAHGEGGLLFLSNRDIEFFDGVRARPLKENVIRSLLDRIPAADKALAVGAYILKDRRYILQIAQSNEVVGENTIQIEYSFKTDTFTVHEYSSELGFNGFVEARKGSDRGDLYGIVSSTGIGQTTTGAVQIIGDVMYENVTNLGVAWSFKTKPFDCGEPDIEKRFIEAIIKMKTPEDISLDYDVDDGQARSSSSITISNVSVHTWGEASLNWQGSPIETPSHVWGGSGAAVEQVVSFANQNLYGNRIALELSGTATLEGTEIQSIIIVYTRERRIRTTGATT